MLLQEHILSSICIKPTNYPKKEEKKKEDSSTNSKTF